MASLQAQVDSIRAAITTTCTPATVTILNDVLLPKEVSPINKTASGLKKPAKSTSVKQSSSKTPGGKPGAKKLAPKGGDEHGFEQLSPKERSILATEIINATLKSLSEAIKAPDTAPVLRAASSKEIVKASARKALRRSNSLPQSPLQPRSLNRISTSPNFLTRENRSSSSVSITSPGQRPTAECARVAFACLRTLEASKQSNQELPPLQLENGMSVLVGKLISLGLDDLAIKELRILKRRLELDMTPHKGVRQKSNSTIPIQGLAEMLDFGNANFTGAKLGLVITTQLQILRLMTTSRRPKNTEDALPILRTTHPSSPTRLLLLMSKDSKDRHTTEKAIRQLQTLSEILLSLCPSVSPSDDVLSVEPKLSVAPATAIQLQTIALHNRFLWWGLAGHKGEVSKDLWDPFLRCLSTFARRSQCEALETYQISLTAFDDLRTLLSDCSDSPLRAIKSVMAGIYRLLASLSKEANIIDGAIKWVEQLQALLDSKADSEARRCSVAAKLVSLKLQSPLPDSKDEELLLNLLDNLDRPFKGESSEIDDLLTEISHARRSAVKLLAQYRSNSESSGNLSDGMRQMCESLVFLCPRLSLRYLGNSPEAHSATKDIVRYEQRRIFISKPALHSIDSALFLVKMLLSEGRSKWDLIDSKLQDCLLLLDRLDLSSDHRLSSDESPLPSYYTRISNLYFTQYVNMRRDVDNPKDGQLVRVLRRSIDSVKTRPQHERKAAQFSIKLERMAELCKASGRHDELFQTLLSLRDEIIGSGVLAAVAELAATQPMEVAWSREEGAPALGRTLHSLLKVCLKYLKSSYQMSLYDCSWTEDERGAILEYQLDLLLSPFLDSVAVTELRIKVIQELLAVYDKERYPIRRLRVLTRLISIDLEGLDDLMNRLSLELSVPRVEEITSESTKDQGLNGYLKHFKTIALTTIELQQEHPSIDKLARGVAVWASIREKSQDHATFEREIEDVPNLLAHLHIVASFLQMKGHEAERVSVLQLVADISELYDNSSNPDDLVLGFTHLGAQWLRLGYSGKAGLALDRARNYNHRNGVSTFASLQLQLAYCEYLMAIGNFDKVEDALAFAKALYSQEKELIPRLTSNSSLERRTQLNLLISNAYLLYSMFSLERGSAHTALAHAKQCVRLLRRAWANTEEQIRKRVTTIDTTNQNEVEKLTDEISQMSMSTAAIVIPRDTSAGQAQAVANFWCLITPLFQGLSHLSGIYAHHGMFQETIYYAEQAYNLVKEVGSEVHLSVACASLGSTFLKAGVLDKGSELLMEAKKYCKLGSISKHMAILAYNMGSMHGLLGDYNVEIEAYINAEDILDGLLDADYINGLEKTVDQTAGLETISIQPTVPKKKVPAARKPVGRSKTTSKSKTAIRATPPVAVIAPKIAEECNPLTNFKAMILRQRASVLISTNRCEEALSILHGTASGASSQVEAVEHGLVMAKNLLLQSVEQMNADPVYSVLQDSTISFPSVVGAGRNEKNDRLSICKVSPPRKGQATKGGRDYIRSKSPAPDSFFEKLRQAQQHLTEAHILADGIAPMATIHKVSALLNSVSILLSAAGQAKGKFIAHPGLASCLTETARNLALRRERKAIQADPRITLKIDESCWPDLSISDSRRSSLGNAADMVRFQRDFIDIIPKPWTVISISLSDNHHELSITKLQANQSPFVLRLPLGRHNSMDADEEVFGFEQGHSELLEIIDLANESAHDARDRTGREAKTAWWEEREALDARLRDLLENIEKVWLGGFTGIFSQHARRPELLSRFQKSFQNILDKHLPSRSKKSKKSVAPRVTLDSRILDLFIGLGDASDEACDFSEPLTDLLYFVVDVLQFHGELNAYAEIDFDSIVVETMDALRGYHNALHISGQTDEGNHTILILDKALHSFPWESLPCMQGLAVSRLPSIGCLRDRINARHRDGNEHSPDGHYVSRDSGSYILNPSSDLKHTQATFQKDLRTLNEWDGAINREPTEEEIKRNLESKDVLLYFGHGSGAQYIRAREIKKLDKCAVTILMGCSSGALTQTGDFEPYGPPINYMHAGCPALVATLWDVTDKDIDRFAMSTFEHWGLFEPDMAKKGKGKKKAVLEQGKLSLVEAVSKGREACNLRYLNAASVCVYGIPVYFK